MSEHDSNHFDEKIHAAGILAWIEAGGDDVGYWRDAIDDIVQKSGYVPLAQFSGSYTVPTIDDTDTRHHSAVVFLNKQGVSLELLMQLNSELDEAHGRADPGKFALRAAIRAEALAKGEYDPLPLVLMRVIKRATDY